ncbi:putative phage abortive infection protein [Sphingomonas aurantiaca]|uniref:Putative phage abortive infection protein n=1 Tax=Sphingomonas aurantiaca TaxID=185949 RepID=A0A5E7Z028_9SPHN|nr:putative phage abortive infection protein [Sphingomonas aurantiaca]VVT10063.1 putative phage abortive infection protein [Sphingomonas aurantiaca]
MRKFAPWLAAAGVLAMWSMWTYFVVQQGSGHGFFEQSQTSPNFGLSGSFGDSFGGFSALMSALAVLGVILSLRQSGDSESRQSFDVSFFTLLNHFQQIVNSIDVHQNDSRTTDIYSNDYTPPLKIHEGRDALKFMLRILEIEIKEPSYFSDSKIIFRLYSQFSGHWGKDTGHYFRLLYHIFRFIDEKCPGDKVYYSRIVRAHLSEAELLLLAYNCTVGEGAEKFARYVEKYSILHNLPFPRDDFSQAQMSFFQRRLKLSAFRQDPPTKFIY